MNRAAIWAETIAVVAVYAIAILAADRFLVAPRVSARGLSLALAFALVQAVVIAALLIVLFLRKGMEARRIQRATTIRPAIDEALAIEASGQDQLRRLRSLMARSRRDVQEAMDVFAFSVRGEASRRIRSVASDLGIEVIDDDTRMEKLFARAASGNLLERAATIEQLEPYAAALAKIQLVRALTSSDRSRVIAALDMLRAWKRVLPVAGIERLLQHADAEVRARALRALPYVELREDPAPAITSALRDPDRGVRVAAAETAGRMRIDSSVPALQANLTAPERDVAFASACALAALPSGPALLQDAVSAGGPAARTALEVLEKSSMQRLESC